MIHAETGAQVFAVDDGTNQEASYDIYLRPKRLGPAYEVSAEEIADVLNGDFTDVLSDQPLETGRKYEG